MSELLNAIEKYINTFNFKSLSLIVILDKEQFQVKLYGLLDNMSNRIFNICIDLENIGLK